MIRRRFGQHQPEKLAQGKRIGCAPRDRALGVQSFEVTDQQQPEVTARRQAGATLVRVEPLTQSLDEAVEVVLVENLIQSRVERVGGTARQVLGCHPHRGLIRMPLSFAHRHRRSVVRDRACEKHIYSVLFSIWRDVSSWEALSSWSCWH